ncbi:alpha/beta fold hydrolase [Amycolatopsis minnesotensis]|uniref:Prolyl oligopeptidase family serine peptidase n=1 Tax=Amycolatopsis minnesotensis TaxID=337894 RepID=A0ABN2S998_9PSEU
MTDTHEVPVTVLPPRTNPAPAVVTWHMLDAPRSNEAFAAALPMNGLNAWRIHLGLPGCGARMGPNGMADLMERGKDDAVLSFLGPLIHQAADEFSVVFARLKDEFPIADAPIGLLGGSAGGLVALEVLARHEVPVAATALVNPAVRARTVVGLSEPDIGPYHWTEEADRAADALDFLARAEELARPILVVSGDEDYPRLREEASALVEAVDGRLETVAGLAHPLADQPGIEPAPQLPVAKAVDDILTAWFGARLSTVERE